MDRTAIDWDGAESFLAMNARLLDRTIRAADDLQALELQFAAGLLDQLSLSGLDVDDLVAVVAAHIPPTGIVAVPGGTEDEAVSSLDLAPRPDSVLRPALADGVVEAELERLAGDQQDDGGWPVLYATASPQATTWAFPM